MTESPRGASAAELRTGSGVGDSGTDRGDGPEGDAEDVDRPPLAGIPFFLSFLAFVLVERLSAIWGRDPSLWVFGARGGDGFVCNAKYLYLHVAENHPEVRPVWLSKDRAVVRTLRGAGYEAHYAYSPRGVLLELRAGVVLLTQGLGDVNLASAGGATFVQLWHGIPLKTVGWDAERGDRPFLHRYCAAALDDRVDLLALPGEAVSEPLASGLRIPVERHAVAGYPRTDVLVREVPGAEVGLDPDVVAAVEAAAREGPVIAYLPTFRGGASPIDRLDLPALEAFLSERDARLLVKTHPYDRVSLEGEFARVRQLPSGMDVYPLLKHVDVLITDYSSIYVDFLLLDRPVVFYPYDRAEYEAARGFYVDYDAVTPGPRTDDAGELLEALAAALDDDAFAAERRAVRERFFEPPPGTHAERTFRAVRARQ